MNEWSFSPGRRYRNMVILIHVGVWVMFFSWPLVFSHTDIPDFRRFYMRYLISPLLCLCLFYLNYFFLIRRYLFAGKMVRYFLINLLCIGASVMLMHFWQKNLMDLIFGKPDPVPPGRPGPIGWLFLFSNFVRFVLVVGFALAVRSVGRWYRMKMERQAFEKEKNEMELNSLRQQLHPHFLFNTLNNIYALISIDQEKAKTAVHDLSGLLRYVLKQGEQDTVSLSEELHFMNSYIALMSLRLSPNTRLEVDFPAEDSVRSCQVPPLLSLNIVENAFKYGMAANKSLIQIRLQVDRARRLICFHCQNTFVHDDGREPFGGGERTELGLQNLYKRLHYIYGEEFHFEVGPKGDMFEADLLVPCRVGSGNRDCSKCNR